MGNAILYVCITLCRLDMAYTMKRRYLFDILRVQDGCGRKAQQNHLLDHLNQVDPRGFPEDVKGELRNFVSNFCSKVFTRWDASHRLLARFLEVNSTWLDQDLHIPDG